MAEAIDWARRQQAARESWVEVGGRRYKIRRPRALDVQRMMRSDLPIYEQLALDCVVDWERVTEADLAPGVGGDAPVPFTRAAWAEWIGDRTDDFVEVSNKVWAAYQAHAAEKESLEGKSRSTSEP